MASSNLPCMTCGRDGGGLGWHAAAVRGAEGEWHEDEGASSTSDAQNRDTAGTSKMQLAGRAGDQSAGTSRCRLPLPHSHSWYKLTARPAGPFGAGNK